MVSLTREQRMLAQSVRDLAVSEFSENSCSWNGEMPWANLETLGEHGFVGVNFGEEYGGQGMTEFETMLINETVGRVCPDTGRCLNAMSMVAPRTIDMFGTHEAKAEFLPGVAAGTDHIAIAISEPEAGSDVKAMNTTVTEENDELVLNGEKIWVSKVPESSSAVVWVKFPEGLGTVVLEFDDPGVEIVNHYTNMANETQTHFVMEDVVIPEENVLTRGREAFKQQLQALNWERLSAAVSTNGMALCAFDHALEYAQTREQFGQPIGEFQGIEWKLADMAKHLQASRTLAFQAADTANERDRVPDKLEAQIANLYSGEVAERIISEALQIHGANGYQQGHPLEYLYRLTRGYRIAGGTDEVQKNAIATFLKDDGLPWLA